LSLEIQNKEGDFDGPWAQGLAEVKKEKKKKKKKEKALKNSQTSRTI